MDGCVNTELECLKLDDVTADKSADIDVVVVLYTDEPVDVIPMEVAVVVKHVFEISNEIPGGPHSTSIASLDFPEINKVYNLVFLMLSLYKCSTMLLFFSLANYTKYETWKNTEVSYFVHFS